MDMKSYKALPEEYRPRAVAALKAAAVPYSPLKIRAAPAGVVSVRSVANPVRAPLKTIEPMARVEEDIPGTVMTKTAPEPFPTRAAMGGAGAAPRSRSPSPKPAAKKEVLPVGELPEEIQRRIQEGVGESTAFNLANLFFAGDVDNYFNARAQAIFFLLDAISHGKEGNEKIFFQARANEVPTDNNSSLTNPIAKRVSKVFGFKGRNDFYVEVPTETQERILTNGFKDISFQLERRKGTMGNPSGIVLRWSPVKTGLNLRTKAGKEALDKIYEEAAETAKSYLSRIDAKAEEFKDFLAKRFAANYARQQKAKAEAGAKSSFVVPFTRATAEFVEPARFEDVFLAAFGDPKKAKERAAALREKYPGKRIKFFGRKNLNLVIEE